MHIVFEFPIVDCRPLLPDNYGKLPNPEWPNPSNIDKPFIRHFGSVKERNIGGCADWTGESHYCSSHLAMKFNNLHKRGYLIASGIQTAIYNSYRRFFSDGYFVAKIETGFVDNTEKLLHKSGFNYFKIEISKILEHYFSLPVIISGEEIKLYQAGPKLAKSYLKESTSKKLSDLSQNPYVEAGEMIILLIYSKDDALKLPTTASSIDNIALPGDHGTLNINGYKFRHDGYIFKAWLIETPISFNKKPKPVKNILRNLRINLLRIHLEKETVRILLNKIKSKKILLNNESKEAYLADSYLKKTAEKLFRKERFTLEQKNILDFALHSEHSMSPDSFSSLEEGVYYFREQFTRDNIKRLLNGMAIKTILFICASPKDKNPLEFGKEFKQIKDGLQKSTDRNNYKIEIETSVKKSDFLDILTKYRPDYLHISMHSSLKEGLYFEDENHDKLSMSVDEFRGILEVYSKQYNQTIKVIILSACNSLNHANAVKDYCIHAVGTKTVFPADAGVVYADRFYSTLFENNSMNIEACHEAGKKAIEFYNPKFDPINEIPVFEIPILI